MTRNHRQLWATATLVLSSLGLAACSDKGGVDDGALLGDDPIRCEEPIAEDHDPDPDVVEVHLRASATTWDPGTGVLTGLAYNNCVPGPLIMADLGNTLRVIFDNALDVETTVHWHGMRLPNEMDGTPAVQSPVQPGESFTYEFELVDAGMYWYHPHIDVDLQVEQGLQGAMWIRDPAAPDVDTSVVVLDDVLIGDDGQIAPPSEGMDAMMGRFGNLLLANGKNGTQVPMTANAWKLLALSNSANTRFMDLELEGHELLLVGTDGGFLNEPVAVDNVVLAPGERALLLIEAVGSPGETYRLVNNQRPLMDMDDMGGMDDTGDMGGMGGMGGGGMGGGGMGGMSGDPIPDGTTILELVYGKEVAKAEAQPTFPSDELVAFEAEEPAHTWVLGMAMGTGFTIDGATFPDVPLVTAQVGMTTFVIQNDSPMDHPFHIHGERFQVMEADQLAWKDTFIVPAGESITVVSELANPGDWMYHCHILEHEEGGMMGIFQVQP